MVLTFKDNDGKQNAVEKETNAITYNIQNVLLYNGITKKQEQSGPNQQNHTYWWHTGRITKNNTKSNWQCSTVNQYHANPTHQTSNLFNQLLFHINLSLNRYHYTGIQAKVKPQLSD